MANLHGILAELGLESPATHPEREVRYKSDWIVDEPFVPELGHSYEISYGKLADGGQEKHVIKQVRIDGTAPSRWIDLADDKPLAERWQMLPVQAYRLID